MVRKAYVSDNKRAGEVTKIYVGVNGRANNVVKAYVGAPTAPAIGSEFVLSVKVGERTDPGTVNTTYGFEQASPDFSQMGDITPGSIRGVNIASLSSADHATKYDRMAFDGLIHSEAISIRRDDINKVFVLAYDEHDGEYGAYINDTTLEELIFSSSDVGKYVMLKVTVM